MKKLYAIALTAERRDSQGFIFSKSVGYVLASSEEEALGWGSKKCEQLFPASSGYMEHGVDVIVIPDEKIRAAHAVLPVIEGTT